MGMTRPPEGYTTEFKGFNNVPAKKPDRMPTPGSKPTTLADHVAANSNTVRVPFHGPKVPKGM